MPCEMSISPLFPYYEINSERNQDYAIAINSLINVEYAPILCVWLKVGDLVGGCIRHLQVSSVRDVQNSNQVVWTLLSISTGLSASNIRFFVKIWTKNCKIPWM